MNESLSGLCPDGLFRVVLTLFGGTVTMEEDDNAEVRRHGHGRDE